MRSTSFFAALLAAAALGALFLVRRADEPAISVASGTVTLLGDSLNLGVERYLPGAMPGWTVVTNNRVGRSTADGIAELEAGRPRLSSHVVVSLGTNDPPGAVAEFRAGVARVLELLGPNRCVAWATVWRGGAPNDDFNAVLRDAAEANRRVRIVEWAKLVQEHPEWLADDGVHGNESGYRERARAVARAVTGCAPAQTVGEP